MSDERVLKTSISIHSCRDYPMHSKARERTDEGYPKDVKYKPFCGVLREYVSDWLYDTLTEDEDDMLREFYKRVPALCPLPRKESE